MSTAATGWVSASPTSQKGRALANLPGSVIGRCTSRMIPLAREAGQQRRQRRRPVDYDYRAKKYLDPISVKNLKTNFDLHFEEIHKFQIQKMVKFSLLVVR